MRLLRHFFWLHLCRHFNAFSICLRISTDQNGLYLGNKGPVVFLNDQTCFNFIINYIDRRHGHLLSLNLLNNSYFFIRMSNSLFCGNRCTDRIYERTFSGGPLLSEARSRRRLLNVLQGNIIICITVCLDPVDKAADHRLEHSCGLGAYLSDCGAALVCIRLIRVLAGLK